MFGSWLCTNEWLKSAKIELKLAKTLYFWAGTVEKMRELEESARSTEDGREQPGSTDQVDIRQSLRRP